MTCRDLIELHLAAYVAGTLSGDVVAGLERHLGGCAACVAYVNTYRRTVETVRSVARVEMPSDLTVSLRATLRAELSLDGPTARRRRARDPS
jgi:anti-sigma factor RsiW